MHYAPSRLPYLNRSQKKVLSDLQLFQNSRHKTQISSRKLAEITGLSERAVRNAIDRLNELHLIKTYTGTRTCSSEHTVCAQVPVRNYGADLVRGEA